MDTSFVLLFSSEGELKRKLPYVENMVIDTRDLHPGVYFLQIGSQL